MGVLPAVERAAFRATMHCHCLARRTITMIVRAWRYGGDGRVDAGSTPTEKETRPIPVPPLDCCYLGSIRADEDHSSHTGFPERPIGVIEQELLWNKAPAKTRSVGVPFPVQPPKLPGAIGIMTTSGKDHPPAIVIGETSRSLRSRWSGSLDPDDRTVEEPS